MSQTNRKFTKLPQTELEILTVKHTIVTRIYYYKDALYSKCLHALGFLPLPKFNVALNNAHGIFQ